MKKQPLTAAEVERFSADTMTGLDESQVAVRKQQGLTNKVERTVGKSYAAIFLGNIFTFFNMLGLAIMVLMLILGSFSNVFFAVVILANTFIGIIQEIKAKKSIEKLSIMSAPTANAVRGGSECEIAVSDLVLDDVIKLSAGKQIAADCQVLDGRSEERRVGKEC